MVFTHRSRDGCRRLQKVRIKRVAASRDLAFSLLLSAESKVSSNCLLIAIGPHLGSNLQSLDLHVPVLNLGNSVRFGRLLDWHVWFSVPRTGSHAVNCLLLADLKNCRRNV